MCVCVCFVGGLVGLVGNIWGFHLYQIRFIDKTYVQYLCSKLMPKRELTEPLLYLEEFLVELNSFLWLHGVKAVFLAYLDSF